MSQNYTAEQLHQKLISKYILNKPGYKQVLGIRNTKNDKHDIDVIRENHRFLWEEDDALDTWERQLAKRYYDKLYKEYAIVELKNYLKNDIALRWRIEKEVVSGKGQFTCGQKRCDERIGLKSVEVNFRYDEDGTKKSTLVKLRLCPECMKKLFYHSNKRKKQEDDDEQSDSKSKRKRSSREKRHKKLPKGDASSQITSTQESTGSAGTGSSGDGSIRGLNDLEEKIWTKSTNEEEQTREQEINKYLTDLLM